MIVWIDDVKKLRVHAVFHGGDEVARLNEFPYGCAVFKSLRNIYSHRVGNLLDLLQPVFIYLLLRRVRWRRSRKNRHLILRILKNQPYSRINISDDYIEFVIIIQRWVELVVDHDFRRRYLQLLIHKHLTLLIGSRLINRIHQPMLCTKLLFLGRFRLIQQLLNNLLRVLTYLRLVQLRGHARRLLIPEKIARLPIRLLVGKLGFKQAVG